MLCGRPRLYILCFNPSLATSGVLGSRSLATTQRTSHPSGSRFARCSAPTPGGIRRPRKPSVPHRVQFTRPHGGRTDLWLRFAIQPRVARDADSVLPCSGGAVAACNQVFWLCQPRGDTAVTAPLIVNRKRVSHRTARLSSSRGSRRAPVCVPPL
jgi:hypothetical protein